MTDTYRSPTGPTSPGRRSARPVVTVLALVVGLSVLVGVSAGCVTGREGRAAAIVVTGSSTVAPLMAEIGARFEESNPPARVDVQTGGSSRGIADVRSGLADIGMVSRSLTAEEADLLAFPIARDGICVIVNAANPVAELTEEQIVAVYTGRVTDWADLGGPALPITVVNKAEGRSTLELFLEYFALASPDVVASVVIGDNEQGIKTVAGNRGAVGYVSVGAAETSVAAGVPIRTLPLEGVAATREHVADGTFPLSRELNLVTAAEPEGAVRALIDFARSDAVFDLIEALAFVPLER